MERVLLDDYNVFWISNLKLTKENNLSKKRRLIQSPKSDLKALQKNLIPLYEKFPLHSAANGVKGKGSLSAAIPHFGAKFLLKIDIK